ncbi:hypothetical protein GCM10023260_06920 [Bartonella acomydis]|uniref:Surface protein/Bartonella adhesin n=1 Tax=Bartonella acomydis TaxID=686234 RepID=A0ABP9MJQ9_9HYPH
MRTAVVAFLLNTSPVYAKNFDIIEQILQVLEKATTVYSQANDQNIFSAYNRYNCAMGFFDGTSLSKASYLTTLNAVLAKKVSTSSSYTDFLTTMLSEKDKTTVNVLDKDSSSIQKSLDSSVDDDYYRHGTAYLNMPNSLEEYPIQVNERTFASARAGSNATFLGLQSNAAGERSVAVGFGPQALERFAIAVGDHAQATNVDSIAIGHMAHAFGKSSIALGSEYNEKSEHGSDDYTTAKGDYSTALGAVSRALGVGSTAVGHRAYATAENAISIGFYSNANAVRSIVVGAGAKATTMGSVALGGSSVADIPSQVFGFNPLLKRVTTDTSSAWKSGRGAVSVGTLDKTRQITKVAAGTLDTDAVNIAQLKSLQSYVDKGWKLSVGGENAKAISVDDTVDFSAASSNLNIIKGKDDNKVKFDLAKELTLNSVVVGQNIFDATGLIISNGPKIVTNGIDAGNKKITGVESGTQDTDAVNFSQLQNIEKQVEQQVAASGFVKQDTNTKDITIGKDTEGDKIDIANKNNEKRTLTGIKNGALTEDSSEAVTGSQLFITNQKVDTVSTHLQTAATNIAKTFGGNAKYEDDKWIDPTFTVKSVKADGSPEETSYNNVADAFAGVGTSIINVQNQVASDITNKFSELTQNITNIKQKVAGDALLWNDEAQAFVARHKQKAEEQGKTTRTQENSKITFLLDGVISKDSTDAITGKQLYSMSNTFATYLNKGAGYDEQGNWKAPNFKVKTVNSDGREEDKTYQNVSDALTDVGTSFTNVQNKFTKEITNQINNAITIVQGESLVKKDKETNNINIGKEVEGSEVNITNSKSEKRTLTGIKDGTADADAVNFSQLKGIKQEIRDKVKEVKEQVVASGFVKQDAQTKHITIGKDTDGDKIDITNNKNEKRTLTGIKNGALSKDSNEAVTGSQLFITNQQVNTVSTNLQTAATNIAKSFGGSAKYENDKWSAPTFTLKTVNSEGKEENKTYQNVAEALTGVGISFTNVQKKVTEQVNHVIKKVESENLVQQEKETNNITIGARKEGSIINIANKNGEARMLSGVKAATKDNEAVNKGQLDTSIKDANNEITNKFNDFTKNITNITQQVKGDALLWDKDERAFIADHGEGDAKTKSKITHLLDGNIASGSTDAISGGQIYKIGEDISKFLGGNASFNNGAFTGPSYTLSNVNEKGEIKQVEFKDIGKAFTSIDRNIQNTNNHLENKFKELNQNITNITQQVRGDALLWSEADKAFIADHGEGGVKTKSKITHLLDGVISSGSTDAITGSQLYSMGSAVSASLGGGASYKGGSWIAPTFTVNEFDIKGNATQENYKTVADALSGLSTSLTNTQNKITNEIAHVKSESLVKQDDKTKLITIGGGKDGTVINIANKDKEDRTLSGIKTATQDNEAVNKAQLDKLDKKIETTNSFAVFYDKQSDGTVNYKSVIFGGKNKEPVALHNVADGALTQESHDAINGGQITKIFQQVVKYFGGNAAFKEGIFTEPIYKLLSISENGAVGQKDHNNIGSAFEGLNTNIKNVNKRIKEVSQGISDDSLLWDKNKEAFVALHGKGETRTNSKITYLKNGDITANSSDAVNGSQLYSLNEQLATYFGGGAGYDKQGNWQAPNFKIKQFGEDEGFEEKSYSNIADALSGVGNSFMNIQHKITHEISKIESKNLVKQDKKTKRITIGGEKDGREISIANSESGVRSLSGVKAGLLTVESTEAINGFQLYSVINILSRYFSGDAGYKDGKWFAPNFKVAQFTADGVVSKRKSYTNVASAFEGINESMTNINNRIHDVEQSVSSSGLNWSETEKAFDARHKGQESKIKHVAEGEISEGSKEAVNGRQLWQTNKKVEEVESHVNMLGKQVKGIANVADTAVKYDKGNDGKKINKVTLVGVSESDPVLIDNVAEGCIESGSKEAVTGGQLYDYMDQQMKVVLADTKKYTDERFNGIVNGTVNNVVTEAKSYTDIKFEALRYEIKEVQEESRRAAAIGLAVSNLSYEDTPGSLSLSIGTGTWRNQSAFSVGAGYISEDGRIRSNISATSSGRHWGIGAGLRVKLN